MAGRKALITGGDSGMGRAAAIAYAREGADVAINYFPTEEADAKDVIELIKAEGRKAIALPGDLREDGDDLVARRAPLGPEVHQHRLGRAQHRLVEARLVDYL